MGELRTLERIATTIEEHMGWPADVEWTLDETGFVILQARPITTGATVPEDRRRYYLSLSPSRDALAALCDRAALERLPDGSFGRVVLDHYDRDGLEPAKLVARRRGIWNDDPPPVLAL